ncbi:MAG: phosphate signaling complex protein PhoU [Bacteroides sp.]|nr:phosphate signaling complex protein PhoU [Bacteroides sp.]
MKHTEKELLALREEVNEMWRLVASQLDKAKNAFLTGDVELGREVISREKRVNTFELKIESDCENYIALYNPVAIDLRLVLSVMKICSTLERIGDFAEGIARHVVDDTYNQLTAVLKDELELEKMFNVVLGMLQDSYDAPESENTKLSGKILSADEEADTLYTNAMTKLATYIEANPAHAACCLKTMVVIRKIERIGDHCSNIVEEIVFYIDAKVLKHSKNKD